MSTAKKQYTFHRRFWQLVFNEHVDTHIRVPNEPGLEIQLIGMAADLHGPHGICTDCPRDEASP